MRSSNTSGDDESVSSPILVDGCDGPYKDYLTISTSEIQQEMDAPKSKRRGPRGGVSEPFPVKLYEMLVGVQREGRTEVVAWQSHGRCFIIHQPQVFVDEIMNRYFKQSKLTSFQRQLNLYGFQRVSSGRDRGGYYHPLFLRGRPDICRIMLRTRVKGGASFCVQSGASTTRSSFYVLPQCPLATAATALPVHEDEDDNLCCEVSHDEDEDLTGSSSDYAESTSLPILYASSEQACASPVRSSSTAVEAAPKQQQVQSPVSVMLPPDLSTHALPSSMVLPGVRSPQEIDASPVLVPNPLKVEEQEEDIGFFEGQRFRCMGVDSLRAYEKALLDLVMDTTP